MLSLTTVSKGRGLSAGYIVVFLGSQNLFRGPVLGGGVKGQPNSPCFHGAYILVHRHTLNSLSQFSNSIISGNYLNTPVASATKKKKYKASARCSPDRSPGKRGLLLDPQGLSLRRKLERWGFLPVHLPAHGYAAHFHGGAVQGLRRVSGLLKGACLCEVGEVLP